MLRSGATWTTSAMAVYPTTCRRLRIAALSTNVAVRGASSSGHGAAAALTLALLTAPAARSAPRPRWRSALLAPVGAALPSATAAPLQTPRRAATTNAPGTVPTVEEEEKRSKELADAEAELRHLQQDVRAIGAKPQGSDGTTAAPPAPADEEGSGVGDEAAAADDGEAAREEPTLADLDRSIPQVDSEFIASLIRSRNLRRDAFLKKKEAVKQRVDQLSKKAAPSLSDAARLPLVGGMGTGWLANLRGAVSGQLDGDGSGGAVVAVAAESPVVASADVLAQLSEEEKDLLHTTRPEYDDGFVLIDCRTVNEVTSWGIIEGAKVLPAHELFDAFHATPEEFLQDYGFAKPRPDDIIICYCQFGPRSLMAAQILSWMGYLKVMHYRDGYYEWGKQYNLLLRRWMEHDKESGNELRRLATFRAALELQREIAPEFNALPMQEAQKYIRDTTRSPGTLLVGEGLRAEAYGMVAKLTEGLAPLALPGVIDSAEDGAEDGADSGVASKSTRTRRLGEGQLTQFLEQATGMNPQREMQQPAASISIGEAQATVIDSLASGAELGASPDAVTSPLQSRSRPN